ncbi:MAG: efflux RND transporter periplasmic adaptor subunit [Saprospiraceae bacterium]|nr:efflux RND transporter periplasmic adaptor subunit [Saprospiraceae bacterium]
MSQKNRKWWIWVLIIVLIGLLVAAMIRSQTRQRGEAVELEPVERRTIVERISASGKIFPEKEVKISSDVSGEIVQLHVMEGDSVKPGQLLVKIDPDSYLSAVNRGRASLNDAKAQKAINEANVKNSIAQVEQISEQLENARRIHERNKELFEDGVISEADFEASETAYRQLQSNLKAAKASLASAEKAVEAATYRIKSAQATLDELNTNLDRTTISAPIEGVVSKLNVEEGERVVGTIQMAGTEIMRIANMSIMEVQVEVSENDILNVELGDEVEIEVDAFLDRKFTGKVTEIASSANAQGTMALTSEQVTNFVVKIRIDPSSYEDLLTGQNHVPFKPGMTATVDIMTEMADSVLSIPIQAVTTREEEDQSDDLREVVFIMNNDTVEMREVETGIQDDEYIEVLEGLQEGESVVTGPYSVVSKELESGDHVHEKEKDKD